MLTKRDITFLQATFVTKDEFESRLYQLKDDLYTKLDAILVEIKAMREDMTVFANRQSMHTDFLENHEERLTLLEAKSGLILKDKN